MKSAKRSALALVTALVVSLSASSALAAIFDFESTPTGTSPSLVLTDSGVTLTITRIGGTPVEVAFRSSYPASWGDNALSPFNDVTGGAFLLTFSQAITSISVDVGDFAPSDADVFSLSAGGLTDSGSQDGGTGFPSFSTLSLSLISTTTAILSGGSSAFPQSVFWDNIRVTVNGVVPVPEPATVALLGLALLALGADARRRRR